MDFQSNPLIARGMRKIGLILLSVLVLEIGVFIGVGQLIGFGNAVLLMFGFMLLGISINPMPRPGQRLTFLNSTRYLAAKLFIMPGFVSDILALVLLIGPVRRAFLGFVMRKILPKPLLDQLSATDSQKFRDFMSGAGASRSTVNSGGSQRCDSSCHCDPNGEVIDIDYEVKHSGQYRAAEKRDEYDSARKNSAPKALEAEDVIDVEHEWKP